METHYFLFTPSLSHAVNGTYRHCMDLAEQLTECGEHELLLLARARAGEPHAITCYEITPSGFKQTRGLQAVHRKKLLKISKCCPLTC